MTTIEQTETESTVTVTEVEGDALYHKYPGQQGPQSCYVSLDCDTGTLSAEWDGIIGAGIPMNVYHGRVRRWSIPALTASAVNGLLDEILPYAETIIAGYERVWDGHNHVGQLTEEASEASEAIQSLCDRDWDGQAIEAWDACDWYGGISGRDMQRRSLGITAESTDDELAAIEAAEENNASPRIINGIGKHLRMLRDEAIDNGDSDDD